MDSTGRLLLLGMVLFLLIYVVIWAINKSNPAQNGDAFVCKRCESKITPKTHTPGSLVVEILVWGIGAWAAFRLSAVVLIGPIIYSGWRLSARTKVCPACKSSELVPSTSPAAEKILKKTE